MSNIIENEARGSITQKNAQMINDYALQHNWEIHKYRQVSVYCNTDHINEIGTVNSGKGRLIIDIRDNVIRIKIKLGNALSFKRQEYQIKCSKDSYEAIAVLLSVFSVKEGFVRTFDRTDYISNHGVKLTIKLNCLMGDHFELERNDDRQETILDFNNIIDEFNLKVWTKEELSQAIQSDHDRVKAQNIYSFLVGEFNE